MLNITIPANTTRIPIEIEIVDDSVLETSETFRLNVKVPQESARLGLAEGAIPSTRVTINNDDSECYRLHLLSLLSCCDRSMSGCYSMCRHGDSTD